MYRWLQRETGVGARACDRERLLVIYGQSQAFYWTSVKNSDIIHPILSNNRIKLVNNKK